MILKFSSSEVGALFQSYQDEISFPIMSRYLLSCHRLEIQQRGFLRGKFVSYLETVNMHFGKTFSRSQTLLTPFNILYKRSCLIHFSLGKPSLISLSKLNPYRIGSYNMYFSFIPFYHNIIPHLVMGLSDKWPLSHYTINSKKAGTMISDCLAYGWYKMLV